MHPARFFIAAALLSAQAQPSFDDSLARIRSNVAEFENRLPDFICQEKITSRTIAEDSGAIEKVTVIESAFSGRQRHATFSRKSFVEDRRVEKVNAAAATAVPKGVFLVGGGYSSSLVSVFGAAGEANYSFSAAPADAAIPNSSLCIAFVSANGHQKIRSKEGTHSFTETGRACFDASLQVLRLERRIMPEGGRAVDEVTIAIDYQPVRIGDEAFRMPARVTASAHKEATGGVKRGEYLAEYSNYRKYGSSSAIQYSEGDK